MDFSAFESNGKGHVRGREEGKNVGTGEKERERERREREKSV